MDTQILMKDMKVIPKELFRRADGEIYDEAAEQDTQDNKEVKQLLTETMLEDMKVIPKELFRHADGEGCGKASEEGQ